MAAVPDSAGRGVRQEVSAKKADAAVGAAALKSREISETSFLNGPIAIRLTAVSAGALDQQFASTYMLA